jgi:crotonobetainyl-CoA:carnitine CoA-transferase CaiB-like acyl-CoA transferase
MPDPTASPAPADELPFRGLKVLDASQGLAGPYCAMLLAQHGADVIKLEPPEGDWSRAIGTRHGSHSAIDLMANRGKRSLAVDLKREGAAQAVLRVAAQCDVVIESFRPGVVDKLGIGYRQVRERNPDVVYLSVSGFGQQGPAAQLPATDTVIQGFSGMMSLNADVDGRPRRLGFLAVDTVTALYAFQALSAALYGRLRGLPGRHIDVSLMQSTAAFLTQKLVETALEGEHPIALNVPAGVYRTQDGWIAITLSKEAHYAALCRATERADLADDPAFDSFVKRALHAPYLQDQFAAALLQRSTADWLVHLAANGVVASRVHTPSSWLDDPLVVQTDAAPRVSDPACGEFRFPRVPGAPVAHDGDPRARWPGVGDAGREILADFGFSEADIASLLGRTGAALPT